MEKKLIIFHQVNHDEVLRHAKLDLANYNELMDQVTSNIPGFKATISNLEAILNNPKEYAFDSIMGGQKLNINGVPIGRDKAIEFIEYPQSWLTVISVVNKFKSELSANPKHKGPYIGADSIHSRMKTLSEFEIVKNRLVLKQSYLENLKSRHSVYTENALQNEALTYLNEIYQGMEKLHKLGFLAYPDLESLGITVRQGLGVSAKVDYNPVHVLSQPFFLQK